MLKIFFLFILSFNAFSQDRDLSIKPVAPEYFTSLNQSFLNDTVKSEAELRTYFSTHRDHKSKQDIIDFESYLDKIISLAKISEYSLGIPWQLSACNSYVESRFNNDVKSHVGAIGMSQLMPKTLETISNIGYTGFNDKELAACYSYCPTMKDSIDYKGIVQKFKCSQDTEHCNNRLRNTYLAKVYHNHFLYYFNYTDHDEYDAQEKGSTLIIKKISTSRKGLDERKRSSKVLYPYYYKHAMFLSTYHLYYLSFLMDERIHREKKMSFAKDATSPIRFMQILAGSYNGGKLQGLRAFTKKEAKNIQSLYAAFNKYSSKESVGHAHKVGRCLSAGDTRAPYFKSKTTKKIDPLNFVKKKISEEGKTYNFAP